MPNYFNLYVFGGWEQLLTLAAVVAVWSGLASLGGLITGRGRVLEAAPFYGWGAATAAFTILGTLTVLPFSILAWIFFTLAALATVVAWRRDGRVLASGMLQMTALALPLLLIVAAMTASQWDEFSHWLPAPRFLLQTDAFPSTDNPVTGTQMLSAYPYNWPLLTYFASKVAGTFLEGAGRLFNVLILMSFGLLALRVALRGAGREIPASVSWPLAGLALMGATLLNPVFVVEKVTLTAYSDTATAVSVALAAYLGWRLLDSLAEGDDGKARGLAWELGLVLALLINIKQVNLVLFLSLLAGVGMAGLRDPAVRMAALLRLAPLTAGLPLAVYILWRYFVANRMGAVGMEATFLPMVSWNIAEIPAILKQMFVVAAKKFAPFLLALVAIGFAVRGIVRFRGSMDRLAIIIATAFLGYMMFMLMIYVTSFSEYDALRAVSFWRYSMHVALLGTLFGAYGVGYLWCRLVGERSPPRILRAVPVMLVLVLPLALAHKLRFDLEPEKPRFNRVAMDLAEIVAPNVPLAILDPEGTGESAVMTRYRMNRYHIPWISGFHRRDADAIRAFLGDVPANGRVLVHSVTDAVRNAVGLNLDAGTSYLLARNGDVWEIARTWAPPF